MIARISALSRRARVLLAATLAVLIVAGALAVRAVTASDSQGVDVAAAPWANAPECARIAKDYPDRLEGMDRDSTDVAGVASWGEGKLILRCGMKRPLPSADSCATVDGVDWLWREREGGEGHKVLLTFGRTPGVEATLSDKLPALDAVLVELSRLVKPIEQKKKCLS